MSLQAAENARATIIDTGSTNRRGVQVTVNANGSAIIEPHGLAPHSLQVNSHLCKRFLSGLVAATPLQALPAAHCVKSASFGSRLFIEYNGERTPDLSCPVQQNSTVDGLKKQALELLKAANTSSSSQKF
jgi:hypothetical protein